MLIRIMARFTRTFLPQAAALSLLVLVAYVPAMRSGFVWDDDDYVTENQSLRSLAGLGQIWSDVRASPQYYPLVFTTFWLEYHLWGANPVGYHVVNILLHALSGALLWRILRRLGIPGAWFAAAMFALHPVHVESVAWIAERKNVLSGVFYLAALLAYLRFAPLDPAREVEPRRWRRYALALFLFVCALLSKTVTSSLPAAILLLVWWKRGGIGRWDILPLLPMFVLGAAMGSITGWLEKHHVGAEGWEFAFSVVERCLIAGRALAFYAAKLLWPVHLTFIYPRWSIDPTLWWQYLFPLAALAVVILLWSLRRRIGRGPLVAVLFFAGTLTPALGFFNVYPMRFSFVADHFQYLASIGLIVLFAASLARRVSGMGWGLREPSVARPAELPARFVLPLVQVALLGTLAVLTWRQAGVYRDLEKVWTDTVTKNPSAWMAHYNLATVLARQNRFDEAIPRYQAALRIQPAFAKAHYGLGNLLLTQGKLDEAIAHYRAALRSEPAYPDVHNNLGLALARQGQLDAAIACYQDALRFRPGYANAHNNLATALTAQGRVDEAIAHYTEALRCDPASAETRNNLANLLARQGRFEEAMRYYDDALRARPDYAPVHYDLAQALAAQGKVEEAINHYREALRLNPAYAEAHNNLANLLAAQGRSEEAVAHYTEALRAAPNWAEAHYNLADTLAGQGKFEEAGQHFSEAIRTKPAFAAAHKSLGAVLEQRGKTNEALGEYQEALRLDPSDSRLRDHFDKMPRPQTRPQ